MEIWDILGLKQEDSKNGIRTLNTPVQMSSFAKEDDYNSSASIWLSSIRDDTLRNVDHKKLQKAEAKILQKKGQRETELARPINITNLDCQASAAQVKIMIRFCTCMHV